MYISGMCTGKKKQNEENEEQEKIGFTQVHTIGDCELRSLLIIICYNLFAHFAKYWWEDK